MKPSKTKQIPDKKARNANLRILDTELLEGTLNNASP
jgi:hypothetical protein